MGRIVDLRSDTLTLPTEAMRRAMYEAELGDDQYDEDPTVNRLQSLAAAMLGMEAALLTISGTMSNLVAALTHCQPGDEIILDASSHCYNSEVGGFAALGGLMSRQLVGGLDGLDPVEVERAVRPAALHRARTGLIMVENTFNRGGGSIIPIARLAALADVGRRHAVPIHMDGARLFNAAVALKVDAREIARYVDTVAVCLSKGLCAPLGSILAGPAPFIEKARRTRQRVGGGMRQAGVIAAAGIVALETMVDRLAEDHANARALAEGAAASPGLGVDLAAVQTNMLYIDFTGLGLSGAEAVGLLAERGVRALATGPSVLRFVTYRGITAEDIDHAVGALQAIAQSRRPAAASARAS